VAAHAITVIGLAGRGQDPHRPGPIPRRALARRWLVTIAAALIACAPVVVWGWLQRTEIAWITKPTVADVRYLAGWLSLGSVTSAALMGLLAVLGSTGGDPPAAAGREARADRAVAAGLTWLAVPWLVLPPLTLMAVSEIKPVYSFRYVVFCLPAVALLAGAGLASLRWAGRAAAAGLIVALALPAQLGLRVQGSGMRTAAGVLAARSRPGDAVIYPGPDIPPWYLAYPQAFGHLHDIGMAQSSAAAGRLYGTTVPLPVLLRRESGFSRIWVIEPGPGWQDPGRYLAPGFRLVQTFRPGAGVWLGLYQRLPETSARVTGHAPGTGGRTAQA
jgi:mannosyltransferase